DVDYLIRSDLIERGNIEEYLVVKQPHLKTNFLFCYREGLYGGIRRECTIDAGQRLPIELIGVDGIGQDTVIWVHAVHATHLGPGSPQFTIRKPALVC